MATTALYAGLLGLWLVALSARVIAARRNEGVSLGHGDNAVLERRMRAQGNFVEYAPLGLLLMALLEASAGAAWWLHVIGLALLGGRVLHGLALSFTTGNPIARIAGMVLTLTTIGIAAIANVVVALM